MTRICPADPEPTLASPGTGLADGCAVPGGAYADEGLAAPPDVVALEPAVVDGPGLAAAATANWYRPRSR